MHRSHFARFGVVVVALACAMHEAAAQGPGAMNPRMGGNRGGGIGAGVGGGVAGSSVPMMGSQRVTRQGPNRSFNSAAPQTGGSRYGGMFSRGAVTAGAQGAAGMRSSEAFRSSAKAVQSGGMFGFGNVPMR